MTVLGWKPEHGDYVKKNASFDAKQIRRKKIIHAVMNVFLVAAIIGILLISIYIFS